MNSEFMLDTCQWVADDGYFVVNDGQLVVHSWLFMPKKVAKKMVLQLTDDHRQRGMGLHWATTCILWEKVTPRWPAAAMIDQQPTVHNTSDLSGLTSANAVRFLKRTMQWSYNQQRPGGSPWLDQVVLSMVISAITIPVWWSDPKWRPTFVEGCESLSL